MLQINTGKLFANGVGRTNSLRGVLYSNMSLMICEDIQTLAGTLRNTGGQNSKAIVYELEERIEKSEDGPGVLLSHNVDPYLYDFAAVASFGLNVTMSPNSNLVHRLTSGEPILSSYDIPSKFIRRCFDKDIYIKEEEVVDFQNFVEQLLGLERKVFLRVMRAIKTYVTGVHRIADDLSLAYTLMVTAVESLAQNFDGHTSTWEDVNAKKRVPIDKILGAVDNPTATEIREVIRSVEHLSIGSRYCGFVLNHIDSSFFRSIDALQPNTVAKCELKDALKNAYNIRSKYVHNLLVLPDEIKVPFDYREIAYTENCPALTLQGIARITRYVIKSFVNKSTKVEREQYNYRREEAGVMTLQMAPQYWVANPLENAKEVIKRLEGFLQQLVSVFLGTKDAVLTDIRPVLADIERLIDHSPNICKPPMLLLHVLFNNVVAAEQKVKGWVDFSAKYKHVIVGDTADQLVGLTIIKKTDFLSIDTHQALHEVYFKQRAKKSGFRAPQYFEAAASLELAERYRLNGDFVKVRDLISTAVENFPSCQELHKLEKCFAEEHVIDWYTILFSKGNEKPTE